MYIIQCNNNAFLLLKKIVVETQTQGDIKDEMEVTIGIKCNCLDITNFQSRVVKPFLTLLKENNQNRFNSLRPCVVFQHF